MCRFKHPVNRLGNAIAAPAFIVMPMIELLPLYINEFLSVVLHLLKGPLPQVSPRCVAPPVGEMAYEKWT